MRPYSTTTPSSGRPSGYRFNFLQNVGGHTVQHHGKIASSFGQPLGSPFGPFQDSAGNAARPYYTTASSSGRLSSSLFGPVQDAGRHTAQNYGETASSSSRAPHPKSFKLQPIIITTLCSALKILTSKVWPGIPVLLRTRMWLMACLSYVAGRIW